MLFVVGRGLFLHLTLADGSLLSGSEMKTIDKEMKKEREKEESPSKIKRILLESSLFLVVWYSAALSLCSVAPGAWRRRPSSLNFPRQKPFISRPLYWIIVLIALFYSIYCDGEVR